MCNVCWTKAKENSLFFYTRFTIKHVQGFLTLNSWEHFSQGVVGGYCNTLCRDFLLQVRPHYGVLLSVRWHWFQLRPPFNCLCGLTQWEGRWETWAGSINTAPGMTALPPASDPNGQTRSALTGFPHNRQSAL